MKFSEYEGNLMGLPTDKNHLNYLWLEPNCKIVFSVCKQGEGASCHFASDKKGLRKLKQACIEFIDFVFNKFEWCKMIFSKVANNRNSLKKLDEKIGFIFLGKDEDCDFYYLPKEVYYEQYR